MAYNPINISPVIPTETPTTDASIVDMSSTGAIPESPQNPQTILPNKANELSSDDVIDWTHRITTSLKYRDNHWNGMASWERFKRLYAGYHQNVWKKNSSIITVNSAFSILRSIMPELYFKDPYFYFSSTKDGEEFQTSLSEHVFNYEWKHKIHGKIAIRKNILDYGIFGWSAAKTGYRFLQDQAKNLIKDGEIEFDAYHTLEQVFVSRLSPFNFLWDFLESPDPNSSRWTAELQIVLYEDVQADSRYKNTGDIKVSAVPKIAFSALSSESTGRYYSSFVENSNLDSDAKRYVFLWVITDRKYDQQITIAEGNEDSALRMIDAPFGQSPYSILRIDEVPDEPFPLSPIGLVEDQILERDRIRTKQFVSWKRFTRKYKAKKGKIDPAEMAKLKRGDDGTVVMLNNMDDLDVIQDPQPQPDMLIAEGAAKSDIVEIIGIHGEGSSGNATKDRVNAVHHSLSSVDRRSIVSDFLIDISQKAMKIMRMEYSFDRVAKISGGQLGSFWVTYTKDDLIDYPCVDIDIGELTPEDPALVRKQLLDLYMTFRGDPNINQRELARRAFKAFPNMRDIDSLFIQDTLYENPMFQMVQRQLQGTNYANMKPNELIRLFRTLMSNGGMPKGLPPAQPNSPYEQANTPGNLMKQPPIRPNAVEGNISNLRNRGINP